MGEKGSGHGKEIDFFMQMLLKDAYQAGGEKKNDCGQADQADQEKPERAAQLGQKKGKIAEMLSHRFENLELLAKLLLSSALLQGWLYVTDPQGKIN